jgi:hypothetical protein
MAARIEDQLMTAEYGGRVVATARYSTDAAADGQGAWIVTGLPHCVFTRNQAITAMVLAERLAAGFGDDDPFVIVFEDDPAARVRRPPPHPARYHPSTSCTRHTAGQASRHKASNPVIDDLGSYAVEVTVPTVAIIE